MCWLRVACFVVFVALAGAGAARGQSGESEMDALNARAVELSLDGKFAEAIEPAKRALEIAEQIHPKHPALGRLLHNLAGLYSNLGRDDEAEPLTKREVMVTEETLGPDHPDTAMALDSLATIYTTQGRYAEAEPLGKRALAIFEEVYGPEHLQLSLTLNNLGRIYAAQKRYPEAEALYRRDMALIEKIAGADSPELRVSLNNLASLYEKQGKYASAEPLMRRAVALAERDIGPNHPQFALLLTNLAALYNSQGKYAAAEPLFRQALDISEATVGTDSQIHAHALYNLSTLHFARQNWREAFTVLERATNITIKRARRSAEIASSTLIGPSESEPVRLGLELSTLVQVGHRLAELETARAQALTGQMFQTAQWARGSEAAASVSLMAARQAKENAALAGLVRERQDLVSEWQSMDKLLMVARSSLPAARNFSAEKALSERLGAIDARIDDIDRTFAKDFPDYAALANPAPLSIEETQAQLGPDEALVLFLDTQAFKQEPEATFIWVLTKAESRWVRIDLGPDALAERIQALRCGLDYLGEWRGEKAQRCLALLKPTVSPTGSGMLPFDLARAQELYAALFGQVEDLIKDKHLLIVPSGALTVLPFHVLVTEKPTIGVPPDPGGYAAADWLAKRQAITVLPSVASLKALRQGRKSGASSPYIGFGDPLLTGRDGTDRRAWDRQKCPSTPQETAQLEVATAGIDQSIASFFSRGVANLEALRRQSALPETTDELCAVARSLGADEKAVHLGEQATERSLKALSADGTLGNSRVVHFATHGLLAGETESLVKAKAEPALMLTPPSEATADDDGLLTASEVTQLKLDADWVIMSACNTAAGEKLGAEAFSGLARAFFYAGARALLVSHWYVSSKAAVSLSTGVFDALKRDPTIGKSEALRRSMLALIQSGGTNAHPANWAPFVLVGEGAATNAVPSGTAAASASPPPVEHTTGSLPTSEAIPPPAAPSVTAAASDAASPPPVELATGALPTSEAIPPPATPSITAAASDAASPPPVELATGSLPTSQAMPAPPAPSVTTAASDAAPPPPVAAASGVVPSSEAIPPLPISKKSFRKRRRPVSDWDWLPDLW